MLPVFPRALRRARLLLLSVVAARDAGAGSAQSTAPGPMPIGMNLRPITPYDRGWVFVDAMKMASDWRYEDGTPAPPIRHTGKGGKPPPPPDTVPVDADGWPRPARGRA